MQHSDKHAFRRSKWLALFLSIIMVFTLAFVVGANNLTAVAKIGDASYDTLAAALVDAGTDGTITIVADCGDANTEVMVGPGVTIELGTHTITASNFTCLGKVVAATNSGAIVAENLTLSQCQTSSGKTLLPYFDGTKYIFSRFELDCETGDRGLTVDEANEKLIIQFKHKATTAINALLAQAPENSGIKIGVRLTWGQNGQQDFVCGNNLVAQIAGGAYDYRLTLHNYKNFIGDANLNTVKLQPFVITDSGAELWAEKLGKASQNWQISGTAERYEDAGSATYIDFVVSDGNKTTYVSGGIGGVAIDGDWNILSNKTKYAFNTGTAEAFLGANRTVSTSAVKAAIYNDTLYAWLDGKLCWRVDLTDANCGGYAAGSEYTLQINFCDGVTGALKDLQVLRGDDVAQQTGFADTLATLNANIDRWSEMRLGHVYGEKAESFTVDYGTWDNAYGYFAPIKGNAGLKVTTGWVNPDAADTWSRVGITVKVGETSHQFVLEEQNSEVKHFTNFGDAVNISADVMRYVNPFKADKSCDMMAVIKDGKLYLYYNGVQGYMASMSDLFSGYTADSEVSLGICNLDSQTGIGTFKNIEILSAADVAEKPATGTDVANMNYDPVADAYLPVTQNGPAYLYNQAIVGNQAVNTTITYYNGDLSYNGIALKIGDQTVQFLGHGGYDHMYIVRNNWESQINHFDHPMTVNNVYSEIKAVINNGKLYMIYNGVQMNPINMTELFPNYQLTDAVQLGIYSHNAPVDWVKFTDTKFYTTAAEVDKLVRFYFASADGANMDTANGNIVKNGYAQVQLEGVSNIWEVTGTLYNYVPGSYLQPAFEVRDTNGRAVQAMIDGNGIQFPWGDYRGDGPYCINPNTGHFHWWGINEMDFRIVVANDILYAWFETAGDGNLIATWHIPLTEYYNGTAYGGCAAGSQYTFKFLLGGDDAVNGQSGLMNVVVRTGENASTEGIW